jgi:hypothetical protein
MVRDYVRDLLARLDAIRDSFNDHPSQPPGAVGGPMSRSNRLLSADLLDANESISAFAA